MNQPLLLAAQRFLAEDATFQIHRREWAATKKELEAANIRSGDGLPDREGLYDRDWVGYAKSITGED